MAEKGELLLKSIARLAKIELGGQLFGIKALEEANKGKVGEVKDFFAEPSISAKLTFILLGYKELMYLQFS